MKLLSMSLMVAVLTLTGSAAAQVSVSNKWWSYLADYEGKPGSTRVDMALIDRAPITSLPYVVIAGTKYETSRSDGLPDIATVEQLNKLSDKLILAIMSNGPAVYAGTFTNDGEQVHYVYVQSPQGAQAEFSKALASACSVCKPTFRTKHDPNWDTYRKFLYPNQQTMDFYRFDPRQLHGPGGNDVQHSNEHRQPRSWLSNSLCLSKLSHLDTSSNLNGGGYPFHVL